MAYPVDLKLDGITPGRVPKVRVTYRCDDADDAMREIHKAVAVHSNVDAHYDRETGLLTMEMS